MKSKCVVLSIAALLLVCSFAFSKGQQQEAKEAVKKLGVLWHQSNIPDDKIVEEYANAWADENGVDLNFQIVDESQLKSKTVAALESKSGPDLILLSDYSAYLYRNSFSNINDLVNGLGEKHGGWFPIAKQAFFFKNNWIAVPYKIVVKPIVYRKDIVQKVGAKVPDTLQDLADVSTKISNQIEGMYGFGVAMAPRSDGPDFMRVMLWGFGGKIQDENGKIAFNSPESLTTYRFLKDWYNRGGIAPGVAGWDDSDNNRAFMAEQIAMTLNASSIYMAAKKDFPDTLGKATGHAMVPKGPAGRFVPGSTQGIGIPLYSENKELAIEFLKYMYTAERLKRITVDTDGGAMMVLNTVMDGLPMWDDPELGALLDVAKVSYLVGYPGKLTRPAAAVRSGYVLVNAAGRMLSENLSPEQTVQFAAKEIEEIYTRYQEE